MARPDLSYLKNILLALLGIAGGIWCGATGIALAPLLAPLLAWLLGARSLRLGGTVLTVTLSAALLSLLAYAQADQLQWRNVACVALASIAGSLIGSLPQFTALRSSRILHSAFILALIGLGLLMILPHAQASGYTPGENGYIAPASLLLSAGAVAGLFAALANVSGILIVPALHFVAHMPMLTAQATSLATLVIVSSAPAVSSVAQQRYSPPAALWCGLGAALGALYGSRVAVHQSETTLNFLYGVSLVICALVSATAIPPSRASFPDFATITRVDENGIESSHPDAP